jgi:hypothetical protein
VTFSGLWLGAGIDAAFEGARPLGRLALCRERLGLRLMILAPDLSSPLVADLDHGGHVQRFCSNLVDLLLDAGGLPGRLERTCSQVNLVQCFRSARSSTG